MAIKAEELRIGNVVFYHGEEIMPCVLGAQDIFNISTNYMMNAEIHSPIPLSPEILEQCGFKMEKEETGPPINDINEIWYHEDSYASFMLDNHNCIIINDYHVNMNRPKYLHQLQNLFYALSGEDLTINLQSKSK